MSRSILAVALAAVSLSPAAAHAARPVSLSDAARVPDVLVLLAPGTTFAPFGCGSAPAGSAGPGVRFYSDVSAYRWDGRPLGAQRWNRAHDRILWSARSGRSVTFDGVSFHNGLRGSVLVAGWCERA